MTEPPQPPKEMPSLDLVRAELGVRLEDQDRKSNAFDTRAGLILAGGSVLIGLSADDSTVLRVLSQIVAAIAVVVAGSALWPRVSGAVSIRQLRNRYLMQPEEHTKLKLLDTQIMLYELDEKRLEQKVIRLKIAVGVLAVAVALMLAGSIVELFGDDDDAKDRCSWPVGHHKVDRGGDCRERGR